MSSDYTPSDSSPPAPCDQVLHWLRLTHSHGVGPVIAGKLLRAFGDITTLMQATGSVLADAGASREIINALQSDDNLEGAERDLAWREQASDRHIISLDSRHYPSLLKQIANPPPILYLRGDPEVLHTPQLAIVGSRKPTTQGARIAARLAADIAAYGLTVCSGLAHGIDAQAHRATLDRGGLTIAVTGTGLDRVYPARHHALAHEIVASGALVSEFPIGTNPRPAFFPRRNRIISGLCFGTLVVEAAVKSGSLTTAAHATEQSREVFAVPGNIDNPLARGCHALIKRGATLVESADDILEQLAALLPVRLELPAAPPSAKQDETNLSSEAKKLLALFEYETMSADTLAEQSGLDAALLAQLTTELEFEGHIETNAAGDYLRLR